ncbi:MAG: hypothetical protein PHX54_09065 [Lentimicrobiaceae bacterium]|nr:hypothetical protein [Lentimicrobiaceae bacterium]
MLHKNKFSTIQSFLEKESFQQWVLFPEKKTTGFWDKFYQKHHDKRQLMDQARELLLSLRFKEQHPDKETIEKSLESALLKIQASSDTTVPVKNLFTRKAPVLWWAAAALIPILFLAWYAFEYAHKKNRLKKI